MEQALHHGPLSPASLNGEPELEHDLGETERDAEALAAQRQWQQERAAQLAEATKELLWGEDSGGDEEDAPGGRAGRGHEGSCPSCLGTMDGRPGTCTDLPVLGNACAVSSVC